MFVRQPQQWERLSVLYSGQPKKIAYALQPTGQLDLLSQRPRGLPGLRPGLGLPDYRSHWPTRHGSQAWGYSRPSCLNKVKCGLKQCDGTSAETSAPLVYQTGRNQVGTLPQIFFVVTPASLNRHFLSAPHSQKALKQSHFESFATNPQHKQKH